MNVKNERGFTWYEAVILLCVIVVLIVIAMPNYWRSGSKALEAEVKANCHTIQIALERFYTDNGYYPGYLLGGDQQGWEQFHTDWDGMNDISLSDGRISSNDIIVDPLMAGDYIYSYPHNPFVDVGDMKIIQRTAIGNSADYGKGDPRFGWTGELIGNGLDDPHWFCGALQSPSANFPEIETRRTLDHGDYMNVPEAFQNPTTNPYYLFGGFRDSENPDEFIKTYWPGNFFYRARAYTEFQWSTTASVFPQEFGAEQADYYILGGYGKSTTFGLDVIRLTPFDPDGNRLQYIYPTEYTGGDFYCGYGFNMVSGGHGGLPEVFGGGDEFTGPQFPYSKSDGTKWDILFGAPDGVRDGVIIILTSGSDSERFREWQR